MEYEQIKKIINDMSQSSLSSLNIEFPDGVKINLTKDTSGNGNNITPVQTIVTTQKSEEKANQKEEEISANIVKSQMVGTFYLKPSPDKEDFVKVGDTVKKVKCFV